MPDADLPAILAAYRERDRLVSIGYVRDPQDVPRLLAAVEAVLARHAPKTVRVTHLCGAHHRIVIPDCPDCTVTTHEACAACDPACPDDNQWPCADVAAISRALLGEDGTDA